MNFSLGKYTVQIGIHRDHALVKLWAQVGVLLAVSMLFAPVTLQIMPISGPLDSKVPTVTAKKSKVKAHYQFMPSGGTIVTGTASTTSSASAGNTEGVNVGSWKGLLSDDGFHWTVVSTASGIDFNTVLGGVELNGANTLFIQSEIDLDATVPALMVQICDWVSSTSVDNAADAQCTGGGWRTINISKTALSLTTGRAYSWQLYDGYFTNGQNPGTTVSTPLSNFVNGSSQIKVRFYATTNTTTGVSVDYVRAYAVVNPLYMAGGFTNLGSGTPTGSYASTTIGIGQTGSDNLYLNVPGTAGSVSDFYVSFNNIKTYTGMNTVLVRAEYSCSNTGPTHRPKIYNFTTTSWEDLSTASIACATADATNTWAKNNITMSDYVSNGELRIGWRGLSNSTVGIRLDTIYIMLGTTNTNTADLEMTMGTASSTTATTSIRDIDTTGTTNVWTSLSEDESVTMTHDTYAFDSDADATLEEGKSANTNLPVTVPTGATVTAIFYAGRFMSGTGGTVTLGVKDYSGSNQTTGGWTAVGGNATTALGYTDPVTVGTVASIVGMTTSPEDHVDEVSGQMNLRLRTSTAGTAATNSIGQIDFLMASIQWVEEEEHVSTTHQFVPVSGEIVTGTASSSSTGYAANAEGSNTGSWRGTLADDNYHWIVSSSASGININMDLGNVQLNGANTLFIQTEIDEDATVPQLFVQICDWVSSTSVDAAADAQCTGGGWRTMNLNKAAIAPTTGTAYSWQLYDGYFTNGQNPGSAVSTPLSNFVNGSNKIKVRYYSTTNTTTGVAIDYLRAIAVINPLYMAGGFTNLGSGTPTGSYASTTVGIGQSGSDNFYLSVPGTAGSISDFYLSFRNVKTYTGMNTILVRAEYSCSTTGPTYRPKIYNFTTTSWEDLTTASIACSATDATNAWAKNNVTISDYISNGEIRVGMYGLSNSTVSLRLDLIYIILGTTNTTASDFEISFGTASSTTATTSIRDLDMTGTTNVWTSLSEDEALSTGHDFYGNDNDADAVVEEAKAANTDLPVTIPIGGGVTSVFYVGRIMSGTGGTVQMGVKDYSGFNQTTGGWTAVGATATTALVYTDPVTVGTVASIVGMTTSAEDHVDSSNNEMNIRVRTTVSGTTATNSIGQIDFLMASIQWVEPTTQNSLTFAVDSNTVSFGTLTAGTLASQTTSLDVKTANSTGFNVTVARTDVDSTLDLDADPSIDYPDKTAWAPGVTCASAGNATASSTESQTLQFRVRETGTDVSNYCSAWWGTDDTSVNARFAGFPSSAQSIISRSTSSYPTTTAVILYNIDAPSSQAQGAYTGNITYTATVNP